nr:MAG TPA: hypothetical protein [Caudoviricetes sp.]
MTQGSPNSLKSLHQNEHKNKRYITSSTKVYIFVLFMPQQ